MKKDLELGSVTLRKFIPAGFGAYEVNSQFIPSFIHGATYYDLTPGTSTGFGFEDLVRRFRTEFPPNREATHVLPRGVGPKASHKRRHTSGLQVMNKITAFISYSHDSDEHRERVLGLSERLRADGIATILDRYVEKDSPPEGWPRWMMNGLNAATHVRCVCTDTYRRRFLGQEVPSQGKGVDWEGALVTQALYDARSQTNKFSPVLFVRSDESHIPEPLRPQTHY
ncbi:MAG: SEFIR domain-containing protein, partial [Gammaproteobacteria bacterium]